MADLKLYRVKCTVSGTLKHVWGDDNAPTLCPDGHAIDAAHTAVIGADPLFSPHTSTSLAVAKKKRIAEVDAKTFQLVSAGFQHQALTFGLGLYAQINFLGLKDRKGDPIFPLTTGNIDDTDTITLSNGTEADSFYEAAWDGVNVHRASGETIKGQIRAAATIADVEAVADNR